MSDIQKEIVWGSPLHDKIREEVWARYQYSERYMNRKYDAWRKAEEQFLMYRPEQEADRGRRNKRESEGKPEFVTLHIPYAYAILLTMHTYFSTVFLSRSPILQFSGRHGESEQSCEALESIIDYQIGVGMAQPALSIWLMDVGKFGLGVIGEYWADEFADTATYQEQPQTFLGLPIPGAKPKKVLVPSRQRVYQGNKLYNLRPFDFFPDPRVTIQNFQQGEFCGRSTEISWNEFKRGTAAGRYFNAEALEKNMAGDRDYQMDRKGSSQVNLPAGKDKNVDDSGAYGKNIKSNIKLLEFVIEFTPSEWKLPGTNLPTKWVFTIANGAVVVGAQPMGNYHNKFPYNVIEYEIDGYSHAKRGMLEITNDLNEILTWLFNSRMYNVRKMINGMMVVDPSKIVMKDLTKDGSAKLIRMKPSAYGQEVKNFLQQVQVQDVTQSHIKDSEIVADMLQRVTGVTENIMGMVNSGGRKTATEVRTSSSFGVNRLKTLCEYFSASGFAPLAQKLVQNTQQFYDQELLFRIAGQSMNQSPFIKVSPDSISGFYDFVPVDGTLPIDKFALASLWKEVVLGAVQIPALAQRYDIPGMFGFAAELMGLKNIKQFEIKVQPPGMLPQQAAAGNVVPIRPGEGHATNLGTTEANGAPPGAQTGVKGAPVVSGMGPVA